MYTLVKAVSGNDPVQKLVKVRPTLPEHEPSQRSMVLAMKLSTDLRPYR